MDPVPVEGAGSGFVIDERGYILTNFHVVQEAQSIEVVLGDQSRYAAKFIGADQRNDVALVKIDPKGKKIATLPLGDSTSLQVGAKGSGHRQPVWISEHTNHRGGERNGKNGADQPEHVYRRGDSDRCGNQSRKFGRSVD